MCTRRYAQKITIQIYKHFRKLGHLNTRIMCVETLVKAKTKKKENTNNYEDG